MDKKQLFRRRLLSLPCCMALLMSGCAALATVPPPGGAPGAPAAAAPPPPPTTATAGTTTVVAVAPPAQPCCKQTLPEWLGLSNCCAKIQRVLSAIPGLVGLFAPGLGNSLANAANQPPLLPINNPANLQSSNPAVSTAAQVMNDENQAPQKIAAIKYLATIGCAGCYPDVEASLLASLDDCTESVRFAAAKALHDTTGRPCRHCNSKGCCSTKVRQKLSAVAYDLKDESCYQESSSRVRRMARLALLNCGGDCYADGEPLPMEGPALLPTPAGPAGPAGGAPLPAAPVPPAPQASTTTSQKILVSRSQVESGRQWSARAAQTSASGFASLSTESESAHRPSTASSADATDMTTSSHSPRSSHSPGEPTAASKTVVSVVYEEESPTKVTRVRSASTTDSKTNVTADDPRWQRREKPWLSLKKSASETTTPAANRSASWMD